MAKPRGDVEAKSQGDGEGKLWNMDRPLGFNSSMRYQKVLPVAVIFSLAFQSLGVVYGDLGTSPLYVFGSTFPHSVMNRKDLIGALSLVIYTITLIPLVKYIFIVLRANDNGEDEKLSTFVVNHHHHRSYLQKKLEGS